MKDKKKKNYLVWGIALLLLLALSAFSYAVFIRSPNIPPTDTEEPVATFTIGDEEVVLSDDKENSTADHVRRGNTVLTGQGTIPELRKISQKSTAGAVFVSAQSAEENTVRYMERATGHVYDIKFDSWTALRVSNTTIPKIYNSVWSKDGISALLQYEKENSDIIETYFVELSAQTKLSEDDYEEESAEPEFQLEGKNTTTNISYISPESYAREVSYLTRMNGETTMAISKFDGSGERIVWSSPLKEFVLHWPNEYNAVITTKPSYSAPGYSYLISTSNKNRERLMGGIYGLTVLPNKDVSLLLYSESLNPGLLFGLFDPAQGIVKNVSLKTLPEKCVWSRNSSSIAYCAVPIALPNANYPDDWYKGRVSFQDQIWKIDDEEGSVQLISELDKLTGERIDAVSLQLSVNNSRMIFTNKTNGSLWMLKIKENSIVEEYEEE